MLFPNRHKVTSREDLERHLFELMDHNDAVPWTSDTVYRYLQQMVDWLCKAENFYKDCGEDVSANVPSWQLFADMLEAGAGQSSP
jgi:hypothetical protein